MKSLGRAVFFALVASCAKVTEPTFFPDSAVPMVPPRPYALWWRLTEECAGIQGDFSSVVWFVVPGATGFERGGRTYQGYWTPVGNRIVVAEGAMLSGQLVRHEMLHALVGSGRHSAEAFVDQCGGVVACAGECLEDTGIPPVPAADAAEIESAALLTELRMEPIVTTLSNDSGWVAIMISATNPHPHEVWVRLNPIAEGLATSALFGYAADVCPAHSVTERYTFTSKNRIGFAPHQTRRLVFDEQMSVGSCSLRGFFNGDTTHTVGVRIDP
jgi:hypothetical protein